MGTSMNFKNASLVLGILLLTSGAWAGGQFSLGATYDGWNTNYAAPAQDSGYEVYVPIEISYRLVPELNFYGQGEFMSANDTYTTNGSTVGTYTLSNLSDTVLGGELNFKTFSLNSIFNAAVNIPTGDTTWNTKEQSSIPPTQFIDSRYSGRGLGLSAFYGLSMPAGRGEYSAGVGYLYSGAFNPSYGTVTQVNSLQLGDAVFLALNRVTPFQNEQNEIIRLSVYYSLPTYENGQVFYQLGTNFNASYSWNDAKAFSFELGGQYYLPSSWSYGTTTLTTESNNSNGPRIYANLSYAFGNLTLTALGKYIFQNGYDSTDTTYYNGGGYLAGLEPAYKIKFDGENALKISASLNYIYANNNAVDANDNLTSTDYLFWTVTTAYEMKL